MIVTRRRPRRLNLRALMLPLAAIVALAVALLWPPSHAIIVDGPLKPVWSTLGNAAKPLTFAYQNQVIADRNREIKRLNDSLEADRKEKEAKETRIQALQQQVAHVQAQPKPTPLPARPKPQASAALGASAPAAAAPVGDDVKRTAQYWASMDAEKAAAIAQRLPDDYVNKVFAQMPPDSVGDIMNALPAKVAARLAANAGAQAAAAK